MKYEISYIKQSFEILEAASPLVAFDIATAKGKRYSKKVISIKPINDKK